MPVSGSPEVSCTITPTFLRSSHFYGGKFQLLFPCPHARRIRDTRGQKKWGFVPMASSRSGLYCASPKFLLQFSMDQKVALPLPQEGDLVREDQFCVSLKSLLKS